MTLALLGFGLLAGYIDSIAGGGGLITLPVLLWFLHSGPDAVGTNKIVGTTAALVALLIYRRNGHFQLKQSLYFSLAVGIGAVGGSLVTPYLPPYLFKWFLLVISPLILWILSRREVWVREPVIGPASRFSVRVLLVGFAAGIYDGMWGPGGGTFMFLGLFLVARLPLLQAIASSKLANVCSASFSLGSFALRGYVHWQVGFIMASSVAVGAYYGAHHANKHSARIVRPVLTIVTLLLVLKIFFDR